MGVSLAASQVQAILRCLARLFSCNQNLRWRDGLPQHGAHEATNSEKGQPNVKCDKGFDLPRICNERGRAEPRNEQEAGEGKAGGREPNKKEQEPHEAEQAYGRSLVLEEHVDPGHVQIR
jgi:hypothetical protein